MRPLALETFPFSTRWSTNPLLFWDVAPYILGRTFCMQTALHLFQRVSQASKNQRQDERHIEASVSGANSKLHTVLGGSSSPHLTSLVDHDISINLMWSGALIVFAPWVFPQVYSNMLKVRISIISYISWLHTSCWWHQLCPWFPVLKSTSPLCPNQFPHVIMFGHFYRLRPPSSLLIPGQSPSRTRSHTNMQDRTVPTDDWCFFSTHHRLNKQLIQAGCAFSNAHEGSHQFLQARNT